MPEVIIARDAEVLLRKFARDLCTRTADEIREAWAERRERTALERILSESKQPTFDAQLRDHNPIYYLAEKVWFDNVAGNPNFLWEPLHRDLVCRRDLEYYFAPWGLDVEAGEAGSGHLLLLSRDLFKSTFRHGVLPMFYLLRRKYVDGEDARLVLVHQKLPQAKANFHRLKRKFIDHKWLREVWGELGFCSDDEFGTKEEFTLPNADRSTASEPSVMVSSLGRDLTGFHFDAGFFSDLVIVDHMRSRTLREDTRQRHQGMIFTMLGGKRWYDGTRYHNADLWGGMERANVDGKPIYRVTHIPGIADDGTLAHPTRLSAKKLEALRQEFISQYGDDTFWYLQIQNQPKISRLIATDPAWLRYCALSEVPPDTWRVIVVDPAWKGTDNAGEGDYAAIECWGFERRGNIVLRYMLEVVRSNEMTSLDGEREIFRMMDRWGTIDVAPEQRGGYAFQTQLENAAISRGRQINVIKLTTSQMGKDDRIVSFLRAMQAGQVFITNECAGKEDFLDEYADFPQLDHDDVLDAAGYTSDPAIQECYTPVFNKRASKPFPWLPDMEPVDDGYSRYSGW